MRGSTSSAPHLSDQRGIDINSTTIFKVLDLGIADYNLLAPSRAPQQQDFVVLDNARPFSSLSPRKLRLHRPVHEAVMHSSPKKTYFTASEMYAILERATPTEEGRVYMPEHTSQRLPDIHSECKTDQLRGGK